MGWSIAGAPLGDSGEGHRRLAISNGESFEFTSPSAEIVFAGSGGGPEERGDEAFAWPLTISWSGLSLVDECSTFDLRLSPGWVFFVENKTNTHHLWKFKLK